MASRVPLDPYRHYNVPCSSVVLCDSLAQSCQDDGNGQKKCKPRADSSFVQSIGPYTTGPWQKCAMKTEPIPHVPTDCSFDFQCLCHDVANTKCFCMPQDAYRMERGTPTGCKKADGSIGCDLGKYCRTKGSAQECVDKPYLPGLPLYSQCRRNQDCQEQYICKGISKMYSMCLKP